MENLNVSASLDDGDESSSGHSFAGCLYWQCGGQERVHRDSWAKGVNYATTITGKQFRGVRSGRWVAARPSCRAGLSWNSISSMRSYDLVPPVVAAVLLRSADMLTAARAGTWYRRVSVRTVTYVRMAYSDSCDTCDYDYSGLAAWRVGCIPGWSDARHYREDRYE